MFSLSAVWKNRALLALMIGHGTNDMYASVLPMLYPLVKAQFALDNARIGLITLTYTASGSLLQPVFGHLSDRTHRPWLPSVTLLWSACFVAAYGFVSSYPALLTLAALAGLGSAAYHPLGASNAAAVAGDRHRNSALALYTVGGTSGYALGPIVMVVLLAAIGVHGTALFIVPGVLGAVLLYRQMGHVAAGKSGQPTARAPRVARATGVDWFPLGRVIVVVMLRSWVFLSLLQFVPIWYDDLGYGRGFYGPLTTVIILSGVVGTLGGGVLADRVGGRAIIVASLMVCVPALLLFAGFPGPAAFVTGALFGLASDASLSVTLLAAQRLLPGRTGIASGLVLGLGFITGGIGVPITGRMADRIGMGHALMTLSLLSAIGVLIGATIPRAMLGGRTGYRPEEVSGAPAELAPSARTGVLEGDR